MTWFQIHRKVTRGVQRIPISPSPIPQMLIFFICFFFFSLCIYILQNKSYAHIFICRHIFSLNIWEQIADICLFTSKYFPVYFLKPRTCFHNHGIIIKIKKLTLAHYYYLHHRPYLGLTNCPNKSSMAKKKILGQTF